jgi:phosphoglycolate phosphatase
MRERLVLWDVDHTLLDAGIRLEPTLRQVFAEQFGRPLPQMPPMMGRTFRAIIVDMLTLAEVPDPRSQVASFIDRLDQHAPAVGEQVRARGRLMPGVREALAVLDETGVVRQSLLTGNIRSISEVKLEALGLGAPLDLAIGGYGEMDEVRAGLVGVARDSAVATSRSGSGSEVANFDGEATVLVGDTPLDVEAALGSGARAVAVATGSYTEAELAAAGAHVVLPDLCDTERVQAAIWPPRLGRVP